MDFKTTSRSAFSENSQKKWANLFYIVAATSGEQ
jgi:hypothetical protein